MECGTAYVRQWRVATISIALRSFGIVLLSPLALAFSGCQFVPKSQLDAAEMHSQALLEQKNALLAENENLKTHSRNLEEQVKQAEEELAALEERGGADQHRLSADRGDRQASALHHKRRGPRSADDDIDDEPARRDGAQAIESDAPLDGWTAPGAERR
ncbi:MAG TPA: hypothetical protein VF306_10240 [Pirellulales bacterium]